MKRAGIFVFYDPQGIVDDYVTYLLRQLRPCLDELTVICNGGLADGQDARLSPWVDRIVCRENMGMDAGALQYAFTQVLEPEHLAGFNELVWFNDTCYGPVYPMEPIFREMEQRSCDFWGLTLHAATDRAYGNIHLPEHLQSFFLAMKKPVFTDPRFLEFWQNMVLSNDFHQVVAGYELALTPTFASWGYTYDAYCRTGALDNDPARTLNLTAEAPDILIRDYGFPFLKRKNFLTAQGDALLNGTENAMHHALELIRHRTDYPVQAITANLVRLYDQDRFHRTLCPDRILSADHHMGYPARMSALVLLRMDHTELWPELAPYVTSLPDGVTAAFQTASDDCAAFLQSKGQTVLRVTEPDGIGSLIAHAREQGADRYEYLCLIPEFWDRPLNGLMLAQQNRRSWYLRNLLASPTYITNVLAAMEQEPRLGLFAPPPIQADADQLIFRERELKDAANLAGQFGPFCPQDPIRLLPAAFWCRRKALLPLLRQSAQDTPLLQLALTSILQSGGFISAAVTEQQCAALIMASGCPRDAFSAGTRQMQKVSLSTVAPDDHNLSKAQIRTLLIQEIGFFILKKLRFPFFRHQRDAHTLGIRTLMELYKRQG